MNIKNASGPILNQIADVEEYISSSKVILSNIRTSVTLGELHAFIVCCGQVMIAVR